MRPGRALVKKSVAVRALSNVTRHTNTPIHSNPTQEDLVKHATTRNPQRRSCNHRYVDKGVRAADTTVTLFQPFGLSSLLSVYLC